MSPERARAIWLGYWRAMRVYHRYRAHGIERILAPGPALVVGYHGRPVALDLCMLQSLLWEEHGVLPRAVMHATAAKAPFLGAVTKGMGFVTGDGPELEAALAAGDKLIVTPGGTREGCRPTRDRYRVEWGNRTGYLRLALRHGLPVLPAAGSGVDDTYLALNDGYRWGQRLNLPGGLPAWVGIGPLGLWPLSPPWPVRVTTRIGPPVPLDDIDPADRDSLLRGHARVVAAVQALFP